jgi:hypothetical protein
MEERLAATTESLKASLERMKETAALFEVHGCDFGVYRSQAGLLGVRRAGSTGRHGAPSGFLCAEYGGSGPSTGSHIQCDGVHTYFEQNCHGSTGGGSSRT